ncbi:hypothetical protein [Rubritalea tangerina]|uniref:hypothetical protein n=1 Tax=Rubritalea tangerina TaxID=430798 RepID=UPI00360CDA20
MNEKNTPNLTPAFLHKKDTLGGKTITRVPRSKSRYLLLHEKTLGIDHHVVRI